MKTKVLSIMTAAALTAASFSALALNAAAEEGDLVFEGITFKPWTSTSSLPDASGSYYLTADVSTSTVKSLVDKTIDLCLNGHSVTMTGSARVYNVGYGAVLSLYDNNSDEHYYTLNDTAKASVGTGSSVFYGGYFTSTGSNGCVQVTQKGTFNMYGGNIVGFAASDGGAGVDVNGGIFNMHSGTILGCYSKMNNGAGVYIRTSGSFNMMGGEIRDNKVNNAGKGGGVAVYGAFTVSGDAVITGNRIKNNAAQNVFVAANKTISIGEGGLSDKASIGLTTGSSTLPVVMVEGAEDHVSAFFSDNTGIPLSLTADGKLAAGYFAKAAYAQVGGDYTSNTETDNVASLWKINITAGTNSIETLDVKLGDIASVEKEQTLDTPAITGGEVVLGVVTNLSGADVEAMGGFTVLVNGEAL